jgi:hypothetical protein
MLEVQHDVLFLLHVCVLYFGQQPKQPSKQTGKMICVQLLYELEAESISIVKQERLFNIPNTWQGTNTVQVLVWSELQTRHESQASKFRGLGLRLPGLGAAWEASNQTA